MSDASPPAAATHSVVDFFVGALVLAVGLPLVFVGVSLFVAALHGAGDLLAGEVTAALQPSHLLGLALIAIVSLGLTVSMQEKLARHWPDGLAPRLVEVLTELLLTACLAALCAAAVLALVRAGLAPGDDATVVFVESQLRRLNDGLEHLPRVYLIAAAVFVLAALAGWSGTALKALGTAGTLALRLSKLKTFLSVLLLVSFVGTGAQAGVQAAVARLLATKTELEEAQGKLHRAAVEEARHSVVDDVEAQLRPLAPSLASWQAYARLSAAHPGLLRKAFSRVPAPVADVRKPSPPSGEAPHGTLDALDADALVAAKREIDAKPAADGDHAMRPVAETIVQAALEDTAADFLRSAVLAIRHPVLELLVSSFVNPALAQSVRAQAEARTNDLLQALQDGRGVAAGRERVAARARAWSAAELAPRMRSLSQRLHRGSMVEATPATAPLPASRWDALRERLLAERVRRPAIDAQDDRSVRLLHPWIERRTAADELAALRRAQADLAQLRGEPEGQPGHWKEIDFQAYLTEHPRMAAIWAAAVARAEPALHPKEELDTSVQRGLKAYFGEAPASLAAAALAGAATVTIESRQPPPPPRELPRVIERPPVRRGR